MLLNPFQRCGHCSSIQQRLWYCATLQLLGFDDSSSLEFPHGGGRKTHEPLLGGHLNSSFSGTPNFEAIASIAAEKGSKRLSCSSLIRTSPTLPQGPFLSGRSYVELNHPRRKTPLSSLCVSDQTHHFGWRIVGGYKI